MGKRTFNSTAPLKLREANSIPELVASGVLQSLPADGALPTAMPPAELSARIDAIVADPKYPREVSSVLEPPKAHWRDVRAASWATQFQTIHNVILRFEGRGRRDWDMDNRHEKTLWMGRYDGEEEHRCANSIMVWEVHQLLGEDPTRIGCILADNSRTAHLDSTKILRNEILCIFHLFMAHFRARRDLARMTVCFLPSFVIAGLILLFLLFLSFPLTASNSSSGYRHHAHQRLCSCGASLSP